MKLGRRQPVINGDWKNPGMRSEIELKAFQSDPNDVLGRTPN